MLQAKGTTDTGGMSKLCFEEPEKFARVLEIDGEFVVRLAKILSAFSSRRAVDYQKLEKYCLETNDLFFERFPNAEMRPSVHKLLVHGCAIARSFEFPQIYYAEDGLEHQHKLNRQNSTQHSRQSSRLNRIKDMATYSLYCTDPIISLSSLDYRLQKFKKPYRYQDISEFFTDNDILIASQSTIDPSIEPTRESSTNNSYEEPHSSDDSDDDLDEDLAPENDPFYENGFFNMIDDLDDE